MSQPYSGYSQPNHGGPAKTNPDTRPLPEGWITQFDATYNAWFYVNTHANPPKSEWKHPADLGIPIPQQYASPPGGPPAPISTPGGGSAQDYYQSGNPGHYPQQSQQSPYGAAAYSPYPAAGSPYPATGSPYPQQQQYPQQTPGGSSNKGALGALGGAGAAGLIGKLLSHGGKPSGGGGHSGGGMGGMMGALGGGHGGSQGGYGGGYGGGYAQQPIYAAAPPKKSHAGRNAMLAGGGGLLGGLLIADAIDDIGDDYREEQAYEQGYQDGGDGDFGDF